MTTNPLLDTTGLPRFAEILPEHIAPAIDELLSLCALAHERVATNPAPPTWQNSSTDLALATEKLAHAWGAVRHMHAVVDTPELRAAYTEALPKVTEFWTKLGADERLYARFKGIAASAEFHSLTAEQQRSVTHSVRDFKLGGADLQGADKARFEAISAELATLSQQFREHTMDATDAFEYLATADELAGVPQEVADAIKTDAGYKVTLHQPVLIPVLQYAGNRALREKIYRANCTRASEFGTPELDNSAIMQRIIRLQAEKAALLGFDSYADYSLVTKMADKPAQVLAFLRDMGAKAKPHAQRDMTELQAFATKELGLAEVAPWDVAFASEKLREQRYAYSEQAVKQYFTEPKVIAGLFKVVETLFGVTITPDSAPVWHPSVSFYKLNDKTGKLVGQFYFDLHARPGKQPGAWMDDARARWLRPDGALQTPVTYLTCNYAAPVGDKPALLSHDDVQTLFHEFGHGLHLLLSTVNEPTVGMSAVEWDAIELPSQFMENFCWEWDVVKHMTAHVDTGEQLPRELFDKTLAAKNYQAGMQTVRQLEFGIYDMRLYGEYAAKAQLGNTAPVPVIALIEQVRDEVAVVRPPAYNRMPNTFGHIFGGGYAAGYYSYKWAEVLSADAYSLFEETGVLSAETGAKFRDEILAVGAARPAIESFTRFRGRAPSPDALLRHQGMA
jgi:oligopeptidase A